MTGLQQQARERHESRGWLSAGLAYLCGLAGVFALVMLAVEVATRTAGALERPNLARSPVAWTVFGVDIGQVQLITAGVVITVAFVVGYRYYTRGRRYVGGQESQ